MITCAFAEDRKSTRLNSSHVERSYAVFCLKKKTRRPVVLWNQAPGARPAPHGDGRATLRPLLRRQPLRPLPLGRPRARAGPPRVPLRRLPDQLRVMSAECRAPSAVRGARTTRGAPAADTIPGGDGR